MNKSLLEQIAVGTSVLLFSISAFSFTPSPTPDPDPEPEPCQGECDFTRGPDPTASYLEASQGPYSVDTVNVSRSVSGFGGGTIHYPTGTTGTMGAIAVAPGFVSPESSIKWWGPRLASHGFVVISIATNSIFDNEDSRANQLSASLNYVMNQSNSSSSAISGMVDGSRLGAMGWSMGGGGSLKLSTDRVLKAIIPQAPYYSGSNDFDTITSPALIIACENDGIAPVGSHASPFYNTIPGSTDKAFMEINGGDHYCANSGNANADIIGKYGVAWMKRYMDDDLRYDQFLCGPDHLAQAGGVFSEYRSTCN